MSISRIGLSGLLAAQTNLNMTARNIANVATPGYTRQGVLLTARVGGGVDVGALIRFGDNYKIQQKWLSQGPVGQHSAAESYFRQLEEVMGLEDGSVKAGMDKFFGALDEASADVTNPALRQQVLMAAGGLATSFNNLQQMMRGQLDTLRQQSAATADQINGLSESIADLNRRIADAEATGGAPSELIDQRDIAIDQLAALAEIRTVRQPDGTIDVNLASGTPLVAGNQVGKVNVETKANGEFAAPRWAARWVVSTRLRKTRCCRKWKPSARWPVRLPTTSTNSFKRATAWMDRRASRCSRSIRQRAA